jgi:hypothetical protein
MSEMSAISDFGPAGGPELGILSNRILSGRSVYP